MRRSECPEQAFRLAGIRNVKFYATNVRGEHAGMAMYAGTEPKYAVCDEAGPRLVAMDGLLPGKPAD
jgi:hypothetical protein